MVINVWPIHLQHVKGKKGQYKAFLSSEYSLKLVSLCCFHPQLVNDRAATD